VNSWEEDSIYRDPGRRKREPKAGPRRTRTLFFVAVLVLGVYFGTAIVQTQLKIYQANRQLEQLDEELYRLRQENRELEQQRQYVESDEYVEWKARQELGLVRPDEKVIILTEPEGGIPVK